MNIERATRVSGAALRRRAKDIEDIVAGEAEAGERARRLTGPAIAALSEAGFLSLWVPKALGGLETDFASTLHGIEELAVIDASAAWIVFVVSGSCFAAARMSDEAAGIVHARPAGLLCGSLNPPGRLEPVEGGFRLSGRWPFTSGCDHAAWLLVSGLIHDSSDKASPPAGGFAPVFCLVPVEAALVLDTWHTGGLRATGSNDIEIQDLFVPAAMTFRIASTDDRRSRYHQGPLYRTPLCGALGTPIAAVALGIARRAIDTMLGISTAKTPVGRISPLRNQAVLQADIAKAEAAIRSARSWLYEIAEEITTITDEGRDPAETLRRDLLLASVHATRSAAYAVDLMHLAGGGSSVYASCPLERALRDIHTVTQHRRTAPMQFEIAGRLMLGLEPGDPSVLQ